jgi:hypothetical protein
MSVSVSGNCRTREINFYSFSGIDGFHPKFPGFVAFRNLIPVPFEGQHNMTVPVASPHSSCGTPGVTCGTPVGTAEQTIAYLHTAVTAKNAIMQKKCTGPVAVEQWSPTQTREIIQLLVEDADTNAAVADTVTIFGRGRGSSGWDKIMAISIFQQQRYLISSRR